MSNVNRISVKIEIDPDSDEFSDLDTVAEAFDEALSMIGCGYDDIIDKFFTMRFDETKDGGLAATVSVAEKRD